MFNIIRETGTDDAIIVVTGDIVHGKTDMSPELISLVSYFFTGCADLCTTLVIAGNHDFNLANPSRLDALTPIVEALNHDNLIYWKESGVKTVGNVAFFHHSIMDDDWQVNLSSTLDLPEHVDTKIALYHGAVSGATTDIGFSDFADAIPRNNFDAYDITMLGDIHKTQYLDADETIAYCGSLIQQDYGELPERGFLLWDVPTRKSTFVSVPNDYAYVTIKINGGKIIDLPEPPPKARMRVIHENTDKSVVKEIVDKIKDQYSVSELRVTGIKSEKSHQTIQVDDVINSRKSEVQMKLYREFLANEDLDEDVWKEIDAINNDLNSQIRNVEVSGRGINWIPLEFEFSNMFSYGTGNFIDFSDIEGIVGLFAPNASGKSTLLDSIVFCVFDKCSRTSKAVNVMNNQSSEFHCRFKFAIGDEVFEIIRNAKRNTNGSVSVAVDFYKGDECLNGKRRDETNKIIRDYIGTYDDFILTTMSTQNDNRSFIDMTKKDRQELLYRFLDIYVFIDLFKLAKEESRDLSSQIKLLGANDFNRNIEKYQNEIKILSDELVIVDTQIAKLTSSIDELTIEIESASQKMYNLGTVLDMDDLIRDRKRTVEMLESEHAAIQTITNELERAKKDLSDYTAKNPVQDDTPLTEMLGKLNDAKALVLDDKFKLNSLQKEREHLQSKVKSLDTHEYDPNCKYCVQNPFVKDAQKAENQLVIVNETISELEKKVIAEAEIDRRITTIQSQLSERRAVVDTIAILTRDCERQQSGLDLATSQIKIVESKLAQIDENLQRCKSQQAQVEENAKIQAEISRTQMARKELQVEYYSLVSESKQKTSGLSALEGSLKGALQVKEDYLRATKKYKGYEYFMKAVNRDGVPYMILKRILPVIENEVNEVLEGIVDFTFQLSVGENDVIEGTIQYGDNRWAIELISGMERFILSIAIRSSLIRLSGLPKPNFLAIDEGFGVLDTDKLNSINILFQYLKSHFDFVLCISHISEFKDYVDQLISIKKIDGRSKITL
jgi:DNA repair exonuclease SbcCD ATPase subunit